MNAWWWLTTFFLCSTTGNALIISEILYNPNGSDEGKEWVEIFNDGQSSTNLQNWTFFEGSTHHALSVTQGSFILSRNSYAVIADDALLFLQEYTNYTGMVLDSSWGSLSNSGEYLAIFNSVGQLIDGLNYSNYIDSEDGHSIEKYQGGWNSSPLLGGSPGFVSNFSTAPFENYNATNPPTIPPITNETNDNETNVTPGNETTIPTTNQTVPTSTPTNSTPINNTNPINANTTLPSETDSENNTQKGISLKVNLDDVLYRDIAYTSLFEIKNLDHVTGITGNITLVFSYSIMHANKTIQNEMITIHGLNEKKTAGTGLFEPNESGFYTISGAMISTSVNDSNLLDNTDSKIVEVLDTGSIPCNISLHVFTDALIYNETQTADLILELNNESIPFTIEYWVEDIFGEVFKNKVNTTNSNKKSWKTNIDDEDRALYFKAKTYPMCADVDTADNENSVLFIVKSDPLSRSEKTSAKTDSSVEIEDIEDDVSFGENIDVNVLIYKGNTRKQVLELWIEGKGDTISETTKIKLDDTFSTFDGRVPIQLKPNCDAKYEDGNYDVVIEGLGLKDEKRIKVKGIAKGSCDSKKVAASAGSTSSNQELVFKITSQKIDTFGLHTDVLIENSDDQPVGLVLWSYIYRGSTSYSGDREENKQSLTLQPGTSRTIALTNSLDDAPAGSYKIKVLLNKNSQKTNKEITQNVTIGQDSQIASARSINLKSAQDLQPTEHEGISEGAIPENKLLYLSSTEKAKYFIPHFFFIIFVVLLLVFVLRK